MVTHSSIPAWRIPMDRGAWRLQSMGRKRVGDDKLSKQAIKPLKHIMVEDIKQIQTQTLFLILFKADFRAKVLSQAKKVNALNSINQII